MKKRLLSILLTLCMVMTLLPAALAMPESTVEEPALAALLEEYIQNKKINGNNISIAYYNTVSGAQYLWNGDKYFTAASIYKLPLNMYYYELEAAGEISPDTRIGGYPLSYCHKLSLQYSNNELSEAMQYRLGTYRQYKTLMAKYGGVPAEELPEIYYSGNYFNTAFILNTLKILYERSDFFSEAIGYLKDATPGQWFEAGVPDSECTIAQKYGWLKSGYAHTAGIVYAEEPFLLVVFTQNVGYGERVPGEIARICYDYTQANAGAWRSRVLNFTDVYIEDWYAEPVIYCVEREIIKGTSGTKFSPNDALTRAMFVTMLGRFAGVNGEGSFADVNYGSYYSLYAEWAYRSGILEWLDGSNFAPNEPVTREQTAVMLYRCLVLKDLAPPDADGVFEDFSDEDQISDYAKSAVDALHACGIFQGDNKGRFSPQQHLTRAEAAALFMRLDQYIENRMTP